MLQVSEQKCVLNTEFLFYIVGLLLIHLDPTATQRTVTGILLSQSNVYGEFKFTELQLESVFKLNICTSRFIPELGSQLFLYPKSPTSCILLYFSRAHSLRSLLPTCSVPTYKASLFLKVCQPSSMNRRIFIQSWKPAGFIDSSLDLDFIPQLYLSKSITEVLQRLLSILFIKYFSPSLTKEENKRVCYSIIKNRYSWCSSDKMPLVVLLEQTIQSKLISCICVEVMIDVAHSYPANLTSLRVHIYSEGSIIFYQKHRL